MYELKQTTAVLLVYKRGTANNMVDLHGHVQRDTCDMLELSGFIM